MNSENLGSMLDVTPPPIGESAKIPLPPPLPTSADVSTPGQSPAASLWRWNDRLAAVAILLSVALASLWVGRLIGRAEATAQIPPATPLPLELPLPVLPQLEFVPPPAPKKIAESDPTHLTNEAPQLPVNVAAPAELDDGEVKPLSPIAAALAPREIPIAASEVPVAEVAPETLPPESQVANTTLALAGPLPDRPSPSPVTTISVPQRPDVCLAEQTYEDRKLQTALDWSLSVSDAALEATEEGKLVFLIHVSGNFESPGFT